MPVQYARHYRFTVDQYQRLAAQGFIAQDARVELIDGEIVEMSPIGSRHNAAVDRIGEDFVRRLAGLAMTRVQGSIRLNDLRAPQPDIAVLKIVPDYYASGLPTPEDILLLVEVADTSLTYDRDAKAALYSQNGIGDYWLVDLVQDQVLVHRGPSTTGYQSIVVRRRGDEWAPLALPSLTVTAELLLG
jgi:Uma2 family endonuclease